MTIEYRPELHATGNKYFILQDKESTAMGHLWRSLGDGRLRKLLKSQHHILGDVSWPSLRCVWRKYVWGTSSVSPSHLMPIPYLLSNYQCLTMKRTIPSREEITMAMLVELIALKDSLILSTMFPITNLLRNGFNIASV